MRRLHLQIDRICCAPRLFSSLVSWLSNCSRRVSSVDGPYSITHAHYKNEAILVCGGLTYLFFMAATTENQLPMAYVPLYSCHVVGISGQFFRRSDRRDSGA